MATAWVPQEQGLRELGTCLQQSTEGTTEAQRQFLDNLESFNSIPDFNNYLCYIFVTPLPNFKVEHRNIAGYLLYKHFRYNFDSINPSVFEYLKVSLWSSLSDPAPEIRRTGANATSRLIQTIGPEAWPESLSRLVEFMSSPNQDLQESAYFIISQLCEDIPRVLEKMVVQGQRPLDYIVPTLISGILSPHQKVRIYSLNSIIPFLSSLPLNVQPGDTVNALDRRLQEFINTLFKIASDPAVEVRRKVCQTMVKVLECQWGVLIPHLTDVVDYMLMCTRDKDPELATEACQFWLIFAEHDRPELVDALHAYLEKVVPVLLDCTVYGEDELAGLGAYDEDDADKPDRDQDIKPRFHSSKSHTQEHDENNKDANAASQKPPKLKSVGDTNEEQAQEEEEEEEDDEDEDYSDDDFDDDSNEWTLRKCSAASLDVMAGNYRDELLEILLPHLKEKLWSEDWLQRESGILVLGAIADGCIGIQKHLPVLFPFLLQTLDHPQALVRSITCWTLGKYSRWCASEDAAEENRQRYFLPLIEGILQKVLENNKRVQEAGCSAFAEVEEEAGELLIPYIGPIIKNLMFANSKYQKKNLWNLYDTIETLAESVGDELNKEEYLNILVPPLMERWSKLADDDNSLIPLLECLASIFAVAATSLTSLAGPLFSRSVRIVHSSLYEIQKYNADPQNIEEPEPLYMVCSLDLMSAITTSLGEPSANLYLSSEPAFAPLLQYTLDHPKSDARQSALALIGDMAINCISVLEPVLPQLLPKIMQFMAPEPSYERALVANNAIWSFGEIALQYKQLEPLADEAMTRLVTILVTTPETARNLVENSAITIGRLGFACPDKVAVHLDKFAAPWCNALADVKDTAEKDSAFRGMCIAIQTNPAGLTENFHFFLNAVAKWQNPSPQLVEMFRNIFAGYKSMGEQQWNSMIVALPPMLREQLAQYGV